MPASSCNGRKRRCWVPNPLNALEALFGEMVEVMRAKLKSGEVDAATIREIRTLLKDNGIEARPEANNGQLLKLAGSLPTDAELEAA